MGTTLIIIGAAFLVASIVLSIIILIKAFEQDIAHGFLCLCVPFYIIAFSFLRFQHPRKWLIVGLWHVTVLAGGICLTLGLWYYFSNPPEQAAAAQVQKVDVNQLKQNLPKFPDLPPLKAAPAAAKDAGAKP